MPDVSAVYPYNQFFNGCQTPVCPKNLNCWERLEIKSYICVDVSHISSISTMSISRKLKAIRSRPNGTSRYLEAARKAATSYPAAPSDGFIVVDTIFGMTVPDNYRPLENGHRSRNPQMGRGRERSNKRLSLKKPLPLEDQPRLTELNNYGEARSDLS